MKLVPGSIELVSPKILVFIGLPSSIIFFLIFHSSSLELKKRKREREGGRKKKRKKRRETEREGRKEGGKRKRHNYLRPCPLLRVVWGETQISIKSPKFLKKIKMMFTGRRCESSCIIGTWLFPLV